MAQLGQFDVCGRPDAPGANLGSVGMVPAGSGAILVLDFFVKWAVVLHGRDDTVE